MWMGKYFTPFFFRVLLFGGKMHLVIPKKQKIKNKIKKAFTNLHRGFLGKNDPKSPYFEEKLILPHLDHSF
jgi:hypothetical protein